jgi:hypothetical protein
MSWVKLSPFLNFFNITVSKSSEENPLNTGIISFLWQGIVLLHDVKMTIIKSILIIDFICQLKWSDRELLQNLCVTKVAANGHALAMAEDSMYFQPEQKYSKRTKS